MLKVDGSGRGNEQEKGGAARQHKQAASERGMMTAGVIKAVVALMNRWPTMLHC